MLRPHNFGLLSFAFSLLGFLILPMLPTVLGTLLDIIIKYYFYIH
jgi:hypothetical protein